MRLAWIVAAGLGAGAALAAALVGAVLLFNLERLPMVGAFVRDRLVAELQSRLDASLALSIDAVDLVREEHETRVHVTGFNLRDASGQVLLAAPTGTVTLQTASLAALRLVPTNVQLENLRLTAEIDHDGRVKIGAFEPAEAAGETPAVQPATPGGADAVGQSIGAAFAGLAAFRDSIGGKLPELGIRNAALVMLDKRTARKATISGINGSMRAAEDGTTHARADVSIDKRAFVLALSLSPPEAERQVFTARSQPFAARALLAAAGIETPFFSPETQGEVDFTVVADRQFMAQTARLEAALTGAALTINPTQPPLPLEQARLAVDWQASKPGLTISRLEFTSGASRVAMTGTAMPTATADTPWHIALTAGETVIDPLTPKEQPVTITGIALDMTLDVAARRLSVQRMDLAAAQASARLSGAAELGPDGRPMLRLDLAVGEGDARDAMRIWPRFFAPKTRAWLVEHVPAGHLLGMTLQLDLDADGLEQALKDRPIPETALAVDWRLTRTVLQALEETPPLRDLVVNGQASGREVKIDVTSGYVDAGGGRRLGLTEGRFHVPDTKPDHPEARISLKLAGPAEALLAAARAPGLAPFVPRPVDPALVKGLAAVDLTIQLRLAEKIAPGDVRVGLAGTLKNISIDKVMGLERIESGEFQLNVDRNGLALKGDAKVFGTPATIEIRGAAKSPPVATLTMTMDDAARTRKGFKLGAMLTGPVLAKFTAPISEGSGKDIVAEFDFSRTAITDLIPGWNKKAGQSARARAVVSEIEGGVWKFDKLEVEAAPLSARGLLELGKDGSFNKAALSSFKLSPGDNVQVEASRSGVNTRIMVKGNSFDARPFLKSLQVGSIDKANANNTEILLSTTVLSGFGGELVTNAEIKLEKRGSDFRRFDLNGRFGADAVSARLYPSANQAPVLKVESNDAGAFLRFFDIYSRMQGGELQLSVTLGQGTQQGTMLARGFALRNEPAMKRLVSDISSQGNLESSRIAPEVARRLANTRDVPFDRMTVEFTRTPGRLDVKDAVLLGPEIGGSMTGMMDFQRDRVALTGTFVPAYSLNNMFAKVPVFGPLLGGGKNEGLFAVRYTISGQMSAPALSIDPLTAIAPGFLRKLIDVRGHTQQRGGPALPAD